MIKQKSIDHTDRRDGKWRRTWRIFRYAREYASRRGNDGGAASVLKKPTTIISRLLFNRTHSVWLGAFTNAMLIAWLWVSVSDTSIYTGASVVARYLGF